MDFYIFVILFWYRISNSALSNVPLTLLLLLLSSQFPLLCNGGIVSEKVSVCDITSVKSWGHYCYHLATWRISLGSISIQVPLHTSHSHVLGCIYLHVWRAYLKASASQKGILIWTLWKMTWCHTKLVKPRARLVVHFSFLFHLFFFF